MAKKHRLHRLHHLACEFIRLFPGQQRYGRAATEKQLAAVQEETGWDDAELLWRIQQWAKTRTNLDPWQLVKPVPKAPIEAVEKPAPRRAVDLSEVTDQWRRRAGWIYGDYDEELP